MARPSEVASMIRQDYGDLAAHTAVGGERDLRVLSGILAAAESVPPTCVPNDLSARFTAVLGTIRSAVRSWEIDSRRHHITGREVFELRDLMEHCTDTPQTSEAQIDPALLDVLVPLRNRRAFDDDGPRLVEAAAVGNEQLALIRFDVDNFKRVNDEHGGHHTGDEALKAVAQVATACVRGKGTAYRISGDEFALLLPNHTQSEAIAVAERLRMTINGEPTTSKSITISVSVGIAIHPFHAKDFGALNKAADEAAYDAKNLGKNLVRIVGESAQLLKTRGVQRKEPAVEPKSKDDRDGPAPEITAIPYDGEEAILLIENKGGDAVFIADAQIVEVSPGSVRHTAPYRMRWRDTTTHDVVKEHEYLIPHNGRAKLLLTYWESGGDWGKPSLVVIGDALRVDSYRHDPWEKPSPRVMIEVTIKSVPPLAQSFKRRYSCWIPARAISKVATWTEPSITP